jgi:predicted transcriptional regulator
MPDKSLLPLGAEIISAYVSNNAISADDLSQLVTAVYDSLANLSQIPEASTCRAIRPYPSGIRQNQMALSALNAARASRR